MIKLPSLKGQRVIFLAAGNTMRGDDAFGPLVFEQLLPAATANFLPLNGGEVPEVFTSKIKAFAPDYLIMADAALLPQDAPDLQIIDGAAISNPSLSTHTLPLSVMINFLKQSMPGLKVIFIAARAQSTAFGAEPGAHITSAALEAATAIKAAVL